MKTPIPGYAYALAAAVLFGASAPAAHALLASGPRLSPWLLAGILYLGSGIGLAIARTLAAWHGGLPAESPLKRSDFPWLLGAVVLGGVLGPVFLMEGLARMDAGPASLLLNLEGVFTAGLAWFVFRENFDRRIFIGMVLILLGGALLSWTSGASGSGRGAWAIATACLCWALDNNLTRKVSGSDAAQIAMIKGLVAGTANLSLALSLGATWPPFPLVAVGGLIGFLGYGLSLVCFVLALRQIGSARTGAYFSTGPFVGAALALVFGMESFTWRLLAAGLLMGGGVWLHLTERHDHWHTHEAMDHSHLHWHDAHHQHTHRPGDPPGEPHSHAHHHEPLGHQHPHAPDLHHDHSHP